MSGGVTTGGLRVRRAIIMLVGVVLASVMVALGLWQMNVFRRQGDRTAADLASQPAIALPADTSTAYGRQVTITGTYLPEVTALVGVHRPARTVMAFRTSSGLIVAVVRGMVDGPDASAPPTGTITQTGVWLPSETDLVASPVGAEMPAGTLPLLKVERLAQTWPSPLANGFLVLSKPDATRQGLNAAVPALPNQQGRVRNEGYALQWWVFAAFTIAVSIAFARAQKKPDD